MLLVLVSIQAKSRATVLNVISRKINFLDGLSWDWGLGPVDRIGVGKQGYVPPEPAFTFDKMPALTHEFLGFGCDTGSFKNSG